MCAHWTASETKAVLTWLLQKQMLTQMVLSYSNDQIQWKENLSTADEMKFWPVDCVEMWQHWTQISISNYTILLHSIQNAQQMITVKHDLNFQFWSCSYTHVIKWYQRIWSWIPSYQFGMHYLPSTIGLWSGFYFGDFSHETSWLWPFCTFL